MSGVIEIPELNKKCRFCGTEKLYGKTDKNVYKLYNAKGEVHVCNNAAKQNYIEARRAHYAMRNFAAESTHSRFLATVAEENKQTRRQRIEGGIFASYAYEEKESAFSDPLEEERRFNEYEEEED